MAGNGSWGPFWLFWAGFAVLFSTVGCWPMSDKAITTVGNVFLLIISVALLAISLASFSNGFAVGFLKLIGSILLLGFTFLSFVTAKREAAHSH